MKKVTFLALIVLLAGSITGCIVHGHGGHAVVVPAGHVHDIHCGHYFWEDHWYFVPHHVHGPTCGHAFFSGVWTLGGKVKVKGRH